MNYSVPFLLDGQTSSRYLGLGVILDADRGLLFTDRNTVPSFIGDLYLTFASSIEIPAKVCYCAVLCDYV